MMGFSTTINQSKSQAKVSHERTPTEKIPSRIFANLRTIPRRLVAPIHPSWNFYATIWGIILGLIFGLATNSAIFSHPLYFFLAAILLIISLLRSTPLTIIFAISAGFIFASLRLAPDLASATRLANFVGQSITISGTLSEDPALDESHNSSLRLTNLKLRLAQPPNASEPAPLLDPSTSEPVPATTSEPSAPDTAPQTTTDLTPISGTLYVKLSDPPPDLARSDTLTLSGTLGDSFGTFVGSLYRPKILAYSKPDPPDFFIEFQHFFSGQIKSHIASPEADLGLGYLLGQKSGLSSDFSDQLRAVGMTHVIVASGAHLGILIAAIGKIFGKISKFAGLLGSLLAIFAFVGVIGLTPSMTRAALVAVLSLLTGFVGRSFTPIRLLSFTAAITLLINPSNFLNLGWQLSFASFSGILIAAPLFTTFLYGGKDPPWLASMLITSLATTLVCAPILIYNFGSLSLLTFVANLVILPTLPYAMALIFLTGATSFLAPLTSLFAHLATLLLDLHIWLINFLSQQTTFILNFTSSDARIFLLYTILIPLLIFLHRHKSPTLPLATSPQPP